MVFAQWFSRKAAKSAKDDFIVIFLKGFVVSFYFARESPPSAGLAAMPLFSGVSLTVGIFFFPTSCVGLLKGTRALLVFSGVPYRIRSFFFQPFVLKQKVEPKVQADSMRISL